MKLEYILNMPDNKIRCLDSLTPLRVCDYIARSRRIVYFYAVNVVDKTYTPCPEKMEPYTIFASNVSNCWPIFKILSPSHLTANFL